MPAARSGAITCECSSCVGVVHAVPRPDRRSSVTVVTCCTVQRHRFTASLVAITSVWPTGVCHAVCLVWVGRCGCEHHHPRVVVEIEYSTAQPPPWRPPTECIHERYVDGWSTVLALTYETWPPRQSVRGSLATCRRVCPWRCCALLSCCCDGVSRWRLGPASVLCRAAICPDVVASSARRGVVAV